MYVKSTSRDATGTFISEVETNITGCKLQLAAGRREKKMPAASLKAVSEWPSLFWYHTQHSLMVLLVLLARCPLLYSLPRTAQ